MSDWIIVPEIYEEWPKEIEDCWILVSIIPENNTGSARIIKNNNHPPKTIINSMWLPIVENSIGYADWIIDKDEAIINRLFINEDFRNLGIGTWFVVFLRTYITKTLSLKIVPQKNGVPDPVNHILINIAKKYQEETLEVTTKNGEIKKMGDIDPDTEL